MDSARTALSVFRSERASNLNLASLQHPPLHSLRHRDCPLLLPIIPLSYAGAWPWRSQLLPSLASLVTTPPLPASSHPSLSGSHAWFSPSFPGQSSRVLNLKCNSLPCLLSSLFPLPSLSLLSHFYATPIATRPPPGFQEPRHPRSSGQATSTGSFRELQFLQRTTRRALFPVVSVCWRQLAPEPLP